MPSAEETRQLSERLVGAAREGDAVKVRSLLAGVDHEDDESGCPPLFVDALSGNSDAVKELIQAGAELNTVL